MSETKNVSKILIGKRPLRREENKILKEMKLASLHWNKLTQNKI
jgi:hypothetical protein